jgi:hypothetical protein
MLAADLHRGARRRRRTIDGARGRGAREPRQARRRFSRGRGRELSSGRNGFQVVGLAVEPRPGADGTGALDGIRGVKGQRTAWFGHDAYVNTDCVGGSVAM